MPNELTQNEINQLRPSLEKLMDVKLAALEAKVDAIERVTSARQDAANEWRATITDLTGKFLTRQEHEAWRLKVENNTDMVCEKVQNLEKFQAIVNSKASQTQVVIAYIGVLISIGLGIISLMEKLIK